MDHRIVHLFVFDGLSDWEPGYAVAGVNSPAFQRHPGRFRVETVGPSSAPIRTAGGLTVLPETTLDRVRPAESAMLILPGGGVWDEGGNREAAELAARFLANGVPVAAICAATAGLARTGLLDDRRHTSNAREYLAATGYAGGALYQDEPAVTDGDLITAGATAAVDFAYHIFRRLGIYEEKMVDAWHGLFTTGDPAYFYAMTQADA